MIARDREALEASKAVLPYMRRALAGTIVNVSSVAGLREWTNSAAYSTGLLLNQVTVTPLLEQGWP